MAKEGYTGMPMSVDNIKKIIHNAKNNEKLKDIPPDTFAKKAHIFKNKQKMHQKNPE